MYIKMEANEQAQLDEHRTKVQAFFDVMTPQQQQQLGDWMYHREWLTCQALSAAACDWFQTQPAQVQMARTRAVVAAARKTLNGRH